MDSDRLHKDSKTFRWAPRASERSQRTARDSGGLSVAPADSNEFPRTLKVPSVFRWDHYGFLWAPMDSQGTPQGFRHILKGFHDWVRDYAQRDGKSGYIVDRTGQYRQGRHYRYRQCRH